MRLIILFLFLLPVLGIAQFTDDFSDGNFTSNPVWSGDGVNFEITAGNILHLNAPAVTDESYLSTPSIAVDTSGWELFVRMDFNPSGSNLARIYLMSTEANLEGPLNGYFVQVGGADDEVSLYRQSGTSTTKIIDGTDDLVNVDSVKVLIRVERSTNGLWELEADTSLTSAFQAQGSVTDTTFITSAYFGVLCDYTSTRSDKFYFDDFNVTGNAYLDTIPPSLVSVAVLNSTQLELTFSEPIDPTSLTNTSNYTVDNGIGNPSTASASGLNSTTLTFSSAFTQALTYTLTISDMEDTAGNEADPILKAFEYIVFSIPAYRDVVINEIMADPTPIIGMPDAEFLEIYNTTTNYFSLDTTVFLDGTAAFNFPLGKYIGPNEHVILCDDSDSAAFASFGKVVVFPSFPALTNSGEHLHLTMNGQLMDEVNYSDDWYQDATKAAGGYTLELINPTTPCSGASNWVASADSSGGTPGTQNAVYSLAPDTTKPTITGVEINSLSEVVVMFSEGMDSASMAAGTYTIDNGISVVAQVFATSSSITLTFGQSLDSSTLYTITVANVTDCIGLDLEDNTFSFGIGVAPEPLDLVINELYPDPDETSGIPSYEFVELYNRSDKLIRLEGLELADPGKSSTISTTVALPGEHLIICSNSNASSFAPFGHVAPVSSMPTLNNTGDSIFIHVGAQVIDLVTYSADWYGDSEKAGGGFTLEKVNPHVSCTQETNWRASDDSAGGTPGAQNSVFSLAPDLIPPLVTNASVVSLTQIQLDFSKTMDSASLVGANYLFTSGVLVTSVNVPSGYFNSIVLNITPALDSGTLYTLLIDGGTDCLGNPLVSDSIQIGIGIAPQPYDLVINEIYPVPDESSSIPAQEFVEIYNRTDKLLRIAGLCLSDPSSSSEIQGTFILPNEYVIICDDNQAAAFGPYGTVRPVSSMPSLNNGSDAISLILDSKTIDLVQYTEAWYGDEEKANGGYTLERVNPNDICGLSANWRASDNSEGGTPGKENSVDEVTTVSAPSLLAAQFLSMSSISVVFDRKMDSASLVKANFSANGLALTNGFPEQPYDAIQVSASIVFERGHVYTILVDSMEDCSGKLLSNASVELYLHDSGDIVINEVLSNPRGSGSDFVELYNNSEYQINLQGWSLAYLDSKDSLRFNSVSASPLLLEPSGFVALNEDRQNIILNYPNAVSANLWKMDLPSYSNDEGSVRLYDQLSAGMDRFDYSEELHFALIENTDGVSLERLDPERPSSDEGNWHSASSDVNYATPGYKNSQLYSSAAVGMFSLSSEYISPDNDGYQDVVNIDYKLTKSGVVASAKVYSDKGILVTEVASNQVLGTSGSITWDGTNDLGEKARTGIHIILVETFDLDGNRNRYRLPIVVASKL